jgi:hypothetical protein
MLSAIVLSGGANVAAVFNEAVGKEKPILFWQKFH